MRRQRGLLVLLAVLSLATGVYFVLRGWAGAAEADVKPVPQGSQEIAWIAPATSSEAWERLVAAAKLVQSQWPRSGEHGNLQLVLDKAFLELTADVPEIVFHFGAKSDARLLIRWYKLSGEVDARHWVGKLAGRATPPLALIGGDITDRALGLARVLNAQRGKWAGADPLFLITTATAERYDDSPGQAGDHKSWPKLMEIYDQRTFRFAFTNTRMVEAVLDFVRQNPQVCAAKNADAQVLAGTVTQATPLGTLATLNAAGQLQPFFLYILTWLDDGYSKDLAEAFRAANTEQASGQPRMGIDNGDIQYSVGDYNQPNPEEERAVALYLVNNDKFRDKHQLLVLPTAAQRARRLLRTLCRRAPLEVRNVVVLTGDAISFNNVFRDRNVAWNVQDLPVPLVFFSHRNPVSLAAGFGKIEPGNDRPTTTSTQDLLLNSDVLGAVLRACFREDRQLLDNADLMLDRLRQTRWLDGKIGAAALGNPGSNSVLFFDDEGNRHTGTGEHVIWLKPAFEGSRNRPAAEITVWSLDRFARAGAWCLSGAPLHVQYDGPTP